MGPSGRRGLWCFPTLRRALPGPEGRDALCEGAAIPAAPRLPGTVVGGSSWDLADEAWALTRGRLGKASVPAMGPSPSGPPRSQRPSGWFCGCVPTCNLRCRTCTGCRANAGFSVGDGRVSHCGHNRGPRPRPRTLAALGEVYLPSRREFLRGGRARGKRMFMASEL